ncbi:hypothetical protein BDQ17DRAFT_1412071 [Cyathus striatus]|nr:hypothetical protein BDQ17DRAFT_1412071 [Cyathus striatus]
MAAPSLLQQAVVVFFFSACFSFAYAAVTPFIDQSFYFDYNDASQPIPIPVTKQCETINIKWERSTATGPNPVSPYHLQVYSSAFNVPFTIPAGDGLSFDWQVPFAPDTLYQICMFDKNGNTGGCQATYAMIPADSTPNCANITFNPILDVDAEVDNGPMSQYGWIDQCTDISLTPKNGTPPYTMTVAPQLHPPYTITGNDMKAINWTVSLSWGSGFFVSLEDSAGAVWSYGLLHSGGGGSTSCLVGAGSDDQPKTIKPIIAVGTGVGGVVVGLILGTIGAFLLLRCRRKRRGDPVTSSYGFSNPDYIAVSSSTGVMDTLLNRNSNPAFVVEPFLLPGDQGHRMSFSGASTGEESLAGSSQGRQKGKGAVYVMHHDSGRAPITVFHDDGAEVVELPPRYADGGASSSQTDLLSDNHVSSHGHDEIEARSDSGLVDPSEGPSFLREPRRPDVPRKSRRVNRESQV